MGDIDTAAISREAYELQVRVWKRRDELCPSESKTPLQMFEADEEKQTAYLLRLMHPENACRLLGVGFQFRVSLGRFGHGRGQRFECAGSLDREGEGGEATIAISRAFRIEQQLFTAGHELGHNLLHPGQLHHRDRPVSAPARGSDVWTRPKFEREADYFSACYVMPEPLVVQEFEVRFGRKPLRLTEHVAWALEPHNHHSLLDSEPRSLAFECAVARKANYNANGRVSLMQTFGVSVTAMAMRLEELKLLER